MKTFARLTFLIAALLLTAPALRAANVIDTLGNSRDGFTGLPGLVDQFATAFDTGASAARLSSVTVKLARDIGTGGATVQLWSSGTSSTTPENLVEDLGTITVSNTSYLDYTFTSTLQPVLAATTRYWVSVTYTGVSPVNLLWGNSSSSASTTSGTGAALPSGGLRAQFTSGSWQPFSGTKTQLFSVTSVNERTVTTTDDDNNGATNGTSLREALAAAASAAGPDTITFDLALSGKTINLTSSTAAVPFKRAIEINDATGSVTIDATALPSGLIISDGSATDYSLFRVNAGSTVAFHGVTFLNGGGGGPGGNGLGVALGGAIQNYGTLTCTRCSFVGNQANNPGGNASNGSNGGAIYSENATLSLTHCTLYGNQATGGNGSGNGGAIRADGGSVALTHCTQSGNSASNQGGGLLLAGSALTLTNTIVGGNTATSGSNIQNEGSITLAGTNIVQGTISGGGSAPSGSGTVSNVAPQLAGLAYYGGGTPTMPPLAGSPAIDPSGGATSSSFATDQRGLPRVVDGDANTSTIVDIGAVEYSAVSALSAVVVNNADSGPGSLRDTLAAVPTGSTITFDSTFFATARTITSGNGIEIAKDVTIDASSLAIAPSISGATPTQSTFVVNSGATVIFHGLTLTRQIGVAAIVGGAIRNFGTLTMTRCTLAGNTVSNPFGDEGGGAILNNGLALTMTHCTLSGNSASGHQGGAIYNTAGTLTLTHCTISGNTATVGGGVYRAGGSVLLTNCIVAGNTPDNIFGAFTGSNNLATGDAQLAPLGNYGGPTQTMPPMAGSPALDAVPTASEVPGLTTDQRGTGFPRVVDADGDGLARADIGSAEAQVLLVTTATDESNGPTNGTSLREAIADTSGHADIIRFDPAVFDGQPADVIRLTVPSDVRKQIRIDRSLSVDARNLPSGVTLSGDSDNDGPDSTQDTRIFRVNNGQTVALHGLKLKDGNAEFSVGGGGVYNEGTLTLNQCTLSGNHADNSPGGGGIYNEGTLTLNQCTLSGNHADNSNAYGGGGIYNQGTLTLNQSTLSGNQANYGGGIYSYTSPNFTTTSTRLTQCTVTGNTASNGGGGIFNVNGRTTLTQCTVSGNTAPAGQGSGVASWGNTANTDTVVVNSIIAANTNSSVDFVGGGPTNSFTPQGRNLIGSGNATGDFSTNNDLINDAPLLAPLASNGGPTQTMALLPGSPALGVAIGSTATTDQRGFPIVGTADLGAYESQGSTVTLTSSDNPSVFGTSVTFTATVNELDPDVITPTGTVTFTGDGNPGSPVPLDANGVATFTMSNLSATTHTISATYNGDARLLPSTSNTLNQSVLDLTVGNGNDNGPFSLRQALANAAAHPGPDTITLPIGLNGQTLTLLTQLVINDAGGVTIDASGLSNGFTISGGGTVRLFTVAAGSTGTLKNLTLINGAGAGGSLNGIGGAIYNNTGATLTLDGCTLSGHSTAIGGAIFNNGGVLTLTRCAFTGNAATDKGGAVNSTGGLTARGCTFSGNSATSSGGALYTGGTASLTNCTFTANAGQDGGGVFNQFGGVLALTHCTLAVNSATSSGGGIASGIGALTLTNCIVAQNTAASGADISNSGSTPFGTATVTRVGINIVRSHVNSGNTATDTGPAALNVDPLVNALGDYGGPTPTMPPQPGSPALDQASVLNPALTTDQRGLPRPVGVRPDIGAVEGPIIVVTTPVDELDAPGALGNGVSLREALRDVEAGGTVVFDRAVFNSLSTNTITLTKGPLNPQRNCTLNGALNPGGIKIVQVPTITAQPQPQSVASNAAANFAITVTNLSGGVAYAWRKNGTPNGTTAAALNFANAQEGDEGVYDVVLSEATAPGTLTLTSVVLGTFSATSQPASLIVDGSAVAIKRHPANAMIALGSSHTLSVVAAGPGPLTYQWTLNGKNISGATKASYLIAKAALTNAGTYRCVVKSGANSATSDQAEIGVVDTTPKTVNLLASPTASFTATVNAAGNGTLTYAWLKNGGGTAFNAKSFVIKPAAAEHAGLYTCTVTGLAGTFTGGAPTQLTVSNAAPQLVLPLALPTATIGQAYFYQLPVQSIVGATATSFSVTGALPTGLVFNTTTGVLSGRPTVTKIGGYALSFKAINAKTSSALAPATLTVNVVPTSAVGVFAGPVERSTLNDNLGGRFDLTTTAAGGFSGSLTLGARAKLGFTAQLLQSAGAGDVILYGKIPGLTMSDKTPLTAYIEVFAVEQIARLTLIHPNGTTLVIPAWRNQWDKTKLASIYAAYYTMRLDPQDLGTAPRGYGYASFTVKPDGTLTLAGKLPDGSGVTGGTHVGPDGQILLFNLLYANRGSHVGQFILTPATPVTNNALNGTTSWFKPAPLLPTSTDTVYKAGFGPLNVTAAGGVYVPPAKGLRVMGLLTVPNPNAKLSFTLGGLAPEFTQLLNIVNPSATGLTNTAVITAPITNTTKLPTLDAAKGLFAGSFQINGATAALHRPAPFFGQIVKIGATTQGYGYFLLPTATPKISTSPKLSGRVVLGVP